MTKKSTIKIHFIAVMALLCLASQSFGQAPATSFTAWAGNSGVDDGWGVGTDTDGNIYACGGFNGSITFGSTTLTSSGGRDMYLVKYDSSGTVQWAQKAGGSAASERGRAIAVDAAGNSYVCGYFYTQATFGSITVTSNGGYDAFLAKYNSAGTVQWVKSIGGSLDEDEAFDVAIDSSGNSFVIGYFKGTATFSPGVTLTSSGGADIYIMKHNTAGVFQWVNKVGGSGDDYGYGCIVDPSGNIGVTGLFNGTATFETGSSLTSSGYADIFIAKYNGLTGVLVFAKKAGGTYWDEARGMNCDKNGNFFITGNYKGTATFGSGSASSSITSTIELFGSNYSLDIFTAKYDNAGNFDWVKTAGGGRDEGGRDVACDYMGNVNIVGYYEGNIYFDTLYLENVASHISFAYEDPFAAQYDNSGAIKWAVHGGSGWHDAAYGVTTDIWGNVIVTGTINPDGTTIYWNGMEFLGATNSNNGHDMFVAKMGNLSGPPPLSITITKTDITCNGLTDGTATVTPYGGSLVYSYLWSTGGTGTSITGLGVGTYTVTTTDTSNSSVTDSIEIFQPTPLSADIYSKEETSALSDGMAWVVISGGTPGYTYLWDDINTQSNDTAFNLVTGIYKVVYTDNNLCHDSATVLVADSTTVGILLPTLSSGVFYTYPNPSNGNFNISFDHDISEIVIYNSIGQTVYRKKVKGLKDLHLDLNMDKGVYFICAQGKDINLVKRLIVK